MRILYHLPLSPYCRKVRLVLAEKKLTFTLREERVWEQRPEYLELNPAATVPTLVEENGFAIPDSAVICEYLEEAYQDSTLLGHTHEQRVEVRRLAAWFDGKFDAEVTRNLNGQKYFRRLAGRGHPDAGHHVEDRQVPYGRADPVARRFGGGGAFVGAGLCRRRGLENQPARAGMVRPHQGPAKLRSPAQRPRAGDGAAAALRRSGILTGAVTNSPLPGQALQFLPQARNHHLILR